jgi:ribosomal protein S6--L-glutamate ligase
MILSFHPCIEGDRNIICAGRSPDEQDLKAIQAADAVILSQGCSLKLYEMTRRYCRHVFPNYDARFAYPGKIGQIELFRKTGTLHPGTEIFRDVHAYMGRHTGQRSQKDLDYPLVFKFSWGGEGEAVYLIRSAREFDRIMEKAEAYERSGLRGFLLQTHIPTDGRSLRVVVVGQAMVSYWRIQDQKDQFYSSLAAGAVIDADSDPAGRAAAEKAVVQLCCKTGINLAGFDLIFSASSQIEKERKQPLFLEINYFFGRKGLGGSEKFYALLRGEVEKWLQGLSFF